MSQQEVIVGPRMQDLSPEYAEILVLGNVLQKSGYFKDVRDQAQAVTKILFGRELGFSPIVSIAGIHVIEGKPALSSNLMATLIKRSGKYDYRVKAWTHTECTLTFRERVSGGWEDVGESSFTMDDAKAAGVVRQGGSWSKFPKAMLFARALSQGLRIYCPDVSAAPIYNPEEMGAEVNEDGDVTTLPKSARTVPVTSEDIPISGSNNGAKPTQEGNAPAAAPNSTVEAQGVALESEGKSFAPGSPAVEVVGADCIDQGQAANFHRSFKDALPKKLQKDADAIAHDWLRQERILDVLGKPSALAIKKEFFYEVRDKACEYARTYSI